MGKRTFVFVALFLIMAGLLLATRVFLAHRQKSAKRSDETLSLVKPGQWVRVEGTLGKDPVITCTEIEFLIGDFLDGDWELSGIVDSVDVERKEFRILGLTVRVEDDTIYGSKKDGLKSLADIKPGMLLDLDGTYLKDGTFLTSEMDNETKKLRKEVEFREEVQIAGRLENFDPQQRTFQIMGVTFQLNEQTKGKSVIK